MHIDPTPLYLSLELVDQVGNARTIVDLIAISVDKLYAREGCIAPEARADVR